MSETPPDDRASSTPPPPPPPPPPPGPVPAIPPMPDALREALRRATRIVALTGAGMSAESGVPTFRDAMHGLWARFDPSQLATPAAWRADRETVWAWYEWRRVLVGRAQPHAGHRALASLARVRPEGAVRIATQNVDDLHERAGSSDVVHVHGSLFAPRCDTCGRPGLFAGDPPVGADGEPVARLAPPRCAHCAGGHLRPGVVWFDEPLPPEAWAASVTLCEQADLVLVVGTSGLVQPAARLPRIARDAGAFVAEINPVASEVSGDAHACWRVGAAAGLEALVRDA